MAKFHEHKSKKKAAAPTAEVEEEKSHTHIHIQTHTQLKNHVSKHTIFIQIYELHILILKFMAIEDIYVRLSLV